MWKELQTLNEKTDKLESQSRRNNLHIYGIKCKVYENWDECESKVRDFIRYTLKMSDHEEMEIEIT